MFYIDLDQPGKPYRPGDTITGRIINPGPGPFRHIYVTLEGRSKSKIVRHRGQNRHTYRSRALLCSRQEEAFKDGNSNFRFKVQIPLKTFDITDKFAEERPQYSGGYWDNVWDEEYGFAATGPHDLPPTMSKDVEGFLSTHGEMYIEYKITANVIGENSQGRELRSSSQTFWLTTACPPMDELQALQSSTRRNSPWYMQIKTLKLDPDIASRSLTFKEKWKNMASSKVPELTFNVEVDVPKFIHVGEPIKLEAKISAPKSNGIGPAEADCAITYVAIELEKQVSVRAKTTFGTTEDNNSNTVMFDVLLNPGKPERFGPSHGGFSRGVTFLSKNLRTPPSFQTYNIACSYRLKVKLHFGCAGESKEVSRWYPVKVFSKPSGLPSYRAVVNGTDGMEEMLEDWGPCPKFKDEYS